MFKFLIFILVSGLFACNVKEQGGSREYSSTMSPEVYGVDSMEGSIENKDDLIKKINLAGGSAASLYQYQTLNRYLCERLRYLRNECAVKHLLIPTGQETTLQCDENDPEPSLITRKYQVRVTSSTELSSRLYFVANETYESSLFGVGTAEIVFQSKGSSAEIAPSFSELESLVVKAETSSVTLPNYSSVSVSLSVDGVSLFSGAVLPAAESANQNTEYRIDLGQLLEFSQSDKCIVEGLEFSQIREVAATYTAQNPKVYNPFSESDVSLDIAEKTTVVENEIKKMEDLLNLERSRYADFLSELQQSSKSGCRLSQALQYLSVQLHGSVITEENISYDSKYPMTYPNQSSECMNLNLNFGTGLSWVVDQSTQALLGSTAPQFVPNISGLGLSIGNMKKVSISRPGICIDNEQVAVSKTILGFIKIGDDYNYNVYEKNIFNITGITIMANDLVVYDNRDLSITFDRIHELSWKDPFFEQNQKWLEMLQNDDCNLTQ